MSKFMVKAALVLAVVVGVNAAFASSWAASGTKRTVTTLIVCSNNKSPRLLADLIMVESKQPYLLMPSPNSKDKRIFFCPARGPALEIPEKDLAPFVNFLKPKRIVVLGGELYVPNRYFKGFDSAIPLFSVKGTDWQRIADELEFMLNISGLSRDYKRLRSEMLSDTELYRPISRPRPEAPKTEGKAQPPAAMAAAATAPAQDVVVAEEVIVVDGDPAAAE